MTKKEVLMKMEQGAMVVLVEYRSGEANSFKFRDKVSGKSTEGAGITHNLECGKMVLALREYVEEGRNIVDWKQPFKKGDICALHLESLVRNKGAYTASGKLEVITQ